MKITDEVIQTVKEIVHEYSGGIKGTELIVELWERGIQVHGDDFSELMDFISTNEHELKVLKYTWDGLVRKNFIYSP